MGKFFKDENGTVFSVVESRESEYTHLPYIISEERTGTVSLRNGVDVNFEVQDCLRTFSDGSQEVINDFFSKMLIEPGKEHFDYCVYCGANNGVGGESRQGWDCYMCGGN